jgi:hypothetical protein
MRSKAIAAGFITKEREGNRVSFPTTPRGQAALAAPRMTAAELQMMEWADAGKRIPTALMLIRAYESLWSKGWLEPDEAAGGKLTPAGLTALNNMRAAMGSAEYKETV